MTKWNPRFLAFSRSQGRSPEAQLDHDREAAPGGCMAPFMTWISERWVQWRSVHGYGRWAPLSREDHASFDAWLIATVG